MYQKRFYNINSLKYDRPTQLPVNKAKAPSVTGQAGIATTKGKGKDTTTRATTTTTVHKTITADGSATTNKR